MVRLDRIALGVVAVEAVLAVAALSGCSSSTKPSTPVASAASQVTIKSFAFHPSPLEARVGQTITVTNSDDTTHTFTAVDKSFDTTNLAPGASGTVSLTKAGTINYHCSIHNFMTGVIHVSG